MGRAVSDQASTDPLASGRIPASAVASGRIPAFAASGRIPSFAVASGRMPALAVSGRMPRFRVVVTVALLFSPRECPQTSGFGWVAEPVDATRAQRPLDISSSVRTTPGARNFPVGRSLDDRTKWLCNDARAAPHCAAMPATLRHVHQTFARPLRPNTHSPAQIPSPPPMTSPSPCPSRLAAPPSRPYARSGSAASFGSADDGTRAPYPSAASRLPHQSQKRRAACPHRPIRSA